MKRVFAFVGFTVAITLFILNIISFTHSYFVLAGALILFLVSVLVKSLRQAKVLAVVSASAVFACLIFILVYNGSYLPQMQLDKQFAHTEVRIIDIEEKTQNGYSYIVESSSVDIDNAPQNFKFRLNSNSKLSARYDEKINLYVQFFKVSDNGFDSYGSYGDNIFLSARLVDVGEITEQSKTADYYFIKLRLAISDILSSAFEGDILGLANGILTGDKGLMSDGLNHSFKVCGISHITAVSGLHITVICLCCYYVLKLLNTPKLLNTFITLMVLFVYSGAAGFSKSVIRSGIMLAVMLLSKLVNTKADALNSLGFAVFLICFNPFAVTDAGALLSVSAVLGIVVIKPAFDKLMLPKNKCLKLLYNPFAVSISVTLATIPVMWLCFGQLSILSVFLNLIIVPVVQIALVAVLLFVMLSGISFLAYLPEFAVKTILDFIITVCDFSQQHFAFLFRNISNEIFGLAIAAVLVLIAFSLFISYKADIRIITLFVCIVFAAAGLINTYQINNNVYFYISEHKMVAAYDQSTIVAIDADSKADYYALEEIVKNRPNSKVYLIDCDYVEYIDESVSARDCVYTEISKNIIVKAQNENIALTLYDNVFYIYENYVTINNNKFYRNTAETFSSESAVIIEMYVGNE